MTKTKLNPLHDKVLLRPMDEGEKQYGTIIIPDISGEKGYICTVVGVGPGRMSEFGGYIVPTVQEGDMVLIPKIGATRTEIDGVEYYIIADKEILCIIDKTEE